jgi:hypothetical protein
VREALDAAHGRLTVSGIIRGFWLFPILLILVTNGIVLRFYGIELKSEPLLAVVYLTFACFNIIADAFILFSVLRLSGVAAKQAEAFLCFSILAVYAPLFMWMNVPNTVHSFDIVTYLKAQHLSLKDTVIYFFKHAKEIGETLPGPLSALFPSLWIASYAVYLLATTLVAECVVHFMKADRLKAYMATGLASALTFIPQILVGAGEMVLLFMYANDGNFVF